MWYVFKVRKILIQSKPKVSEPIGNVTFFDILVHLDKKAVKTGVFLSNYWTELTAKLSEWNIKSNWVHMFYRHPGANFNFG